MRHNSWICPDISSAWTSSFAILSNYFVSQLQFVTTATIYLCVTFFLISDQHEFSSCAVNIQQMNTDKFVSDSYMNYEPLRDVSCQ